MELVFSFKPGARVVFLVFAFTVSFEMYSQDILPRAPEWKGKSEALIVKKDHPWITPAEASDFNLTPDYQKTFDWLNKLSQASKLLKIISIGKSAEGREIRMVIATADAVFDQQSLARSNKPLLLIQAGIHAGEIDGKDAGMMLMRDIVNGPKRSLLDRVNILFIPILNVDGHERISAYNRVNQRGPANMGWRTNSRNLNLNRDYAKLDTEEVRAVVGVMNDYDPDLYLDLHVTDGADYQYDITYGFTGGYSPAIVQFLKEKLSPRIDADLTKMNHIPGPLIFATNNRDFQDGVIEYPYSARFSNNYGDVRHLPSILVENHSLKPFRQRVLGTYVFLESVIKILSEQGASLAVAIGEDRAARKKEVVLTWKQSPGSETMVLKGIASERKPSAVTSGDYVVWNAKPATATVPLIRNNTPDKIVKKPKTYWVPSTHQQVIERLRTHGVKMEIITNPVEVKAKVYRITDHKFASSPFEGHISVAATGQAENQTQTFYPGSARIDTDQPLGDLVVQLLEPASPDSFLQWGFFMEIFNRTEYIEEYAIEPLAQKMLANDPVLRSEFEKKKKSDPNFTKNPYDVYEWFYSRSPYVDQKYLLYPVAFEE
jgi:murein tripeptide amidase MpaA